MDNRGEVSQILSGITFDRNNIFDAGKGCLSSPQNCIQEAFLYATLKSLKFATPPHDYPSV